MRNRFHLLSLVFFTLSLFCSPFAMAQSDYPNRPIEVIVAFPPGGTTDLSARLFSEKWTEFLGQPVVVVNKGGAGGMIGTKYVANAKPDGYSLLATNDANMILARLGKKDAGYDVDSFQYIFLTTRTACYFSVKADSRWKTMKDFITEARQNPGNLRYAAIMGAAQHFSVAMLASTAKVDLTLVPYKTSPEIITSLLGGHVDLASTVGLAGMSGSPNIRTIGVAEEERLFDHPEIPTLKEMGFPVFLHAVNALCAPKGTPEAIIRKLYDAQQKVIAKYEKELKGKLLKIDNYFTPMDGKATLQLFKEREKKYKEYATMVGIKME